MLNEICGEIRNYFCCESDKKSGTYTIKNGTISVDGALNGQYIRIVGSVLNDGIYKYPITGLKDETFSGSIWLLKIPSEIITLDTEIINWLTENNKNINSAFNSESFGGYTYSRKESADSWQKFFASRLNRWRKI